MVYYGCNSAKAGELQFKAAFSIVLSTRGQYNKAKKYWLFHWFLWVRPNSFNDLFSLIYLFICYLFIWFIFLPPFWHLLMNKRTFQTIHQYYWIIQCLYPPSHSMPTVLFQLRPCPAAAKHNNSPVKPTNYIFFLNDYCSEYIQVLTIQISR